MDSTAFTTQNKVAFQQLPLHHNVQLFAEDPFNNNDGGSYDEEEIMAEATIKIDDGGSDLTDRFKYKVQALMGTYDPQGDDNDQQNGNILNAMLTFPIKYSFNVVGKTSGDTAIVDKFVEQVKEIVLETTGDIDGIECLITPRTKNFTKVSVQVNVESASMIATVYDNLESLELAVMRF